MADHADSTSDFSKPIHVKVAFTYSADANGNDTACKNWLSNCPHSETAADVMELAEDKNKFIEEFIDVYTKMLEKVKSFFLFSILRNTCIAGDHICVAVMFFLTC